MENLSESQKSAWGLLQGNENVFLTGEAGSGKSYLIRRFTSQLGPTQYPLLASTGVAALVLGGRTFHSFFGLGIMEGGAEIAVKRALDDRRVRQRMRKIKGLVVDEISMISGETLGAAEQIARLAREVEEPWGGLRVIVVGDFAQLPPVERGQRKFTDWAFRSDAWQISNFGVALLKQNLRTAHGEFLEVLNVVRQGRVTGLVRSFLNDRTFGVPEDFSGTRLFPRRQQAEEFNQQKLDQLPGEVKIYPSIYSGEKRFYEAIKKVAPLPEELKLKEEALVMLRQNDPRGRWVNGSTGILKKMESDHLTIELLSGARVDIEPTSFSLLDAEGMARAMLTNFPVNLAWATTIHKSQGMTLDRLAVDLRRLWEPGQAYVALSRITNPDNLWILGWSDSSFRVDEEVACFYRGFDIH